jgi:hypothetical protein
VIRRLAAVAVAVLLVGLAWYFAGYVPAVGVAAAAALAFLLARMPGARVLPIVLAALGAAIAVPSAIQAIVEVGGAPVSESRVGFGWLALVLALVPIGAAALAGRRAALAGALTLLAGLGGAVAINLFYINTFYVAAVPFWLAGTIVCWLGPRGKNLAHPA